MTGIEFLPSHSENGHRFIDTLDKYSLRYTKQFINYKAEGAWPNAYKMLLTQKMFWFYQYIRH